MKRKSKILILSMPVIIILAGYQIYEYGIVNVNQRIDEIQEQHDTKLKMLEKYTAMIAQKPLLEKQIVELKQTRKNEEAKIIAAPRIAIASANLQNTVKGIITEKGRVINSERVEKTEEGRKFQIISVSIDAIFPDIKALSATLLTIETQTPSLVVKEVDIRVRNYTAPKDLIVKLKVAALTGR